MILQPSYLHNWIFYTGKMISLYRIGAQNIPISLNIMAGDDLAMPGARASAGMVITQFTSNNPVPFSQCIKVWELAGTNLNFDNFQTWKRRKTCWSDRKTHWPAHFLRPEDLGPALNPLWPGDVIWRQGSRSTLAQVMACCLTAPSHYLNQCWLIISKV